MTSFEELLLEYFKRIAISLEAIRSAVDDSGVIKTRDVARAQVYSEHLGGKLRGADK